MLDENEFLSPYGIRAVSRYHLDHPYVFDEQGKEYRVSYLPAESDTAMFGGNSNWRGPIWMPVNVLLIRALLNYYPYYGDSFRIECPTGSGRMMNLFEVAEEIVRRLTSIFVRDRSGQRPSTGAPRSSNVTQTGATTCFSTSTSTVTMVQDLALAIKPAGQDWLLHSSDCSGESMQPACWKKAGLPHLRALKSNARWRQSQRSEEMRVWMVAGACFEAIHNALGAWLVRRWALPKNGRRPRQS